MTRFLLLSACLFSLIAPSAAQAVDSLRVFVPLYIFPDRPGEGDGRVQWARVASAADRVPVSAVVNPSNGPQPAGTGDHTAYTEGLPILDSPRIDVLGYIRTCYVGTPRAIIDDVPGWCEALSEDAVRASIAADLEIWLADYPAVEGIFLDEASSIASAESDYTALCRDVRDAFAAAGRPAPRVFLNPGTAPTAGYTASGVCDGAIVFESPAPGWDPDAVPDFVSDGSQPDARFGAIVYAEPDTASMEAVLAEAQAAGLDYVYVSDDGGLNPYDTLPGYWNAEVARIDALNALASSADAPPVAETVGLTVLANPSADMAAVRLRLSRPAAVTAEVFDVQGRRLAVLLAGALPAGERTLRWDAAPAPGAYVLRITADGVARSVSFTVAR